jgi:peptide subunit release factor 1 (eRF1)
MTTKKTEYAIGATDSPQELLEQLLEFESANGPVISLYLDARTDQHGQRTIEPFVKKQMSELNDTFPSHSAERDSFEEDFVRITRYLEGDVPAAAKGVAIFACAAADDLFRVGHFSAPFERNRLLVRNQPHLYPLARMIDQYRRFAVVLADTNRAGIFVFSAGRTREKQEITNVKTKHTKVGGWSQARYQRHEANYHEQHIKEVVEHLDRVVRNESIEEIILAGDEETVVPILRQQLSRELSEKVVDVVSLGIDTPEHELLEESLRTFRRHDSLSDIEKVEHLLDEFRGDNLAVAGVPSTLAALTNGQVEEMLIAAQADSLHFDREEVETVLNVYGTDEDDESHVDPHGVADELVRRAHQFSSARVTFIEDAARLEQVGGVGAFLRYRISDEHATPYTDSAAASRSEALVQKA